LQYAGLAFLVRPGFGSRTTLNAAFKSRVRCFRKFSTTFHS
jgi:hypothetical protein